MAGAALLLAGPLLAVVALAVRLVDGAPVLFVQPRAGRNGDVIRVPKIRTMRDGPDGPEPTRLGARLRRRRLDELPQLACVVTGRLALIGPRPEVLDIAATYGPAERRRLRVRPGVTGLWQLRGRRDVSIHHQIGYDLYYIRKASWKLDLRILLGTAAFVLRPPREGE